MIRRVARVAKRRQMKSGDLAEIARYFVLPAGIETTGWPAVKQKCAELGVEFDPWQDQAGRAILAKRADGFYACSIGGVVMSIPRQVGKTFLIGAIVFALCLLFPGLTVLWTAHRMRTAEETFAKMQAFANRRQVKRHVAKVVLGSGEEEVIFRNGSRVLFGARERGFGRGFDDVDVEMFDEAQILTDNAIDDMVPATNTAANPLLFFVGTPPKPSDSSEVFTAKRAAALDGDPDTLYLEFSADPDAEPEDRKQWKKANPSYPTRTNDGAMLRMKKNLTPASFMREGLGVWDPAIAGMAVTVERWAELADVDSKLTDVTRRVCLSAPKHLTSATFVEAGRRVDGLAHVGVRRRVVLDEMGEIVEMAKVIAEGHDVPILIPPGSPMLAYKAELLEAGVPIDVMKPAEFAQGCGLLESKVRHGLMHHRGEAEFADAVAGLVTKRLGQVDVWDDHGSDVDLSAFVAATCALVRVPVEEVTKVAAASAIFA